MITANAAGSRSRLRTALFCAVLAAGCAPGPPPVTTVFLVRHAEKAAKPATDPGLTPEGEQRARALATILSGAGVDAIFTTQFARTRLTATPLAERLRMSIATIPVNRDAAAFARAVADTIRGQHAGGTVLVVSHSNTVPLIIEALGGPPIQPIAEDVYDGFYIVTLRPAQPARVLALRYGSPGAQTAAVPATTTSPMN